MKTPSFPHDCPSCGGPAYIGMGVPAQCVNVTAKDNRPCVFFAADALTLWVNEMPGTKEPEAEELDIDEEAKTKPGLLALLNGKRDYKSLWTIDELTDHYSKA